jgi:hypothetical protein
MQLLTNLQGKDGRDWLYALNLFLKKQNPWIKSKSAGYALVTKNIAAFNGVTVRPEVQIYLVASSVERLQATKDEVHTHVVEFALLFSAGPEPERQLRIDFDTVLEWYQLPELTENKKLWERVRQHVGSDPTSGYLSVAMEVALKTWPFELQFVNDEEHIGLTFTLKVPGYLPVNANTDDWATERFLVLDPEVFGEVDED